MDHSYAFNYFENKLCELKNEYGFTVFDNNPCAVRNKEDLKLFVTRLSIEHFEENDFHFLNAEEPNNRLDFIYRGQKLSFRVDESFGHIELDFYKTVEFMALLSEKMIAIANPTAVYIAGAEDELKEAWSRGLPIHLPEVNFRHRNVTGKYFKKQEIGSVFIVDGAVTLEEYEVELLAAINEFLEEKSYNIRYSPAQIKAYVDRRKYFCAIMNGDYCKGIFVNKGKMTIENGFENQVFLSRYLNKHPKAKILYKEKGSSEEKRVANFFDFISTLGREAG